MSPRQDKDHTGQWTQSTHHDDDRYHDAFRDYTKSLVRKWLKKPSCVHIPTYVWMTVDVIQWLPGPSR